MRTDEDQLSKAILQALLSPTLPVETELEVAHDPQRIDLVVGTYSRSAAVKQTLGALGVLGRMAMPLAQFEPYSTRVRVSQVRQCMRRQLGWHHHRSLQMRRDAPLGTLWVLCNACTSNVFRGFNLAEMRGWPAGFYTSVPALQLRVVLLTQLPVTRETLPLRLLSRGSVRAQALRELWQLGPEDRLAATLMEVFARLRFELPVESLSSEVQEFLMLDDRKWEEFKRKLRDEGEAKGLAKGITKGKAEGKAEAKAESVLALLRLRGVKVSAAQRKTIQSCSDLAVLERWFRAAVSARSIDDVFAALD